MQDKPQWISWVLSRLSASPEFVEATLLQNLWSGYGELLRLTLRGSAQPSVILKRVVPPQGEKAGLSDLRKRRSYAVEQAYYRDGALSCDDHCRVATCYGAERLADGTCLLLLEDLRNAGYIPTRRPGSEHIGAGLRWLAHFHSRFLQSRPPGLWEQGSYWHLDTRQEEWLRMPPGQLKDKAQALDRRLKGARYQTLIHGDAKPANFCWNSKGEAAAVDFQYVGPGCGIRDVAYFLDCCLGESGCDNQAEDWIDLYFAALRQALHEDGQGAQAGELESEWRSLYPVAWTDFYRFWQGWGSPPPMGPYSRRQLKLALALL